MTDPPSLRRAPTIHPEWLFAGRCETCIGFEYVGFCIKYQTPVKEDDLCDSYLSVTQGRKRMWAEKRELRAAEK